VKQFGSLILGFRFSMFGCTPFFHVVEKNLSINYRVIGHSSLPCIFFLQERMEHEKHQQLQHHPSSGGANRLLSKAMADIEHQKQMDIMDQWERTVFKKRQYAHSLSRSTPSKNDALTPTPKSVVV
jgi:hypothetical protein